MLTRLYIDNFRCFVNFEYRPARKQLILGGNGSGKLSLLDALVFFGVSSPSAATHLTTPYPEPADPLVASTSIDLGTGSLTGWRVVCLSAGHWAAENARSRSSAAGSVFAITISWIVLRIHLTGSVQHWRRSTNWWPIGDLLVSKTGSVASSASGWTLSPWGLVQETEGSSRFVNLSNVAAWYRYLERTCPDQDEA